MIYWPLTKAKIMEKIFSPLVIVKFLCNLQDFPFSIYFCKLYIQQPLFILKGKLFLFFIVLNVFTITYFKPIMFLGYTVLQLPAV